MQYIGHVIIDGQKVRVLVRESKTCRSLKIRKGGHDGQRLGDETFYLKESPEAAAQLKAGKVVKL